MSDSDSDECFSPEEWRRRMAQRRLGGAADEGDACRSEEAFTSSGMPAMDRSSTVVVDVSGLDINLVPPRAPLCPGLTLGG